MPGLRNKNATKITQDFEGHQGRALVRADPRERRLADLPRYFPCGSRDPHKVLDKELGEKQKQPIAWRCHLLPTTRAAPEGLKCLGVFTTSLSKPGREAKVAAFYAALAQTAARPTLLAIRY